MHSETDLSVVIGFKDWGVERLRVACESILRSFGGLSGELIVSDYGSANPDAARRALDGLDVKLVYTATDGTWSRSRALNAGFAISTGRVLISTDADMVFSPKSLAVIAERVLDDPRRAIVLQCRDLPMNYSHIELGAGPIDWRELDAVGRRRPRWGMGGMIAVSRSTFLLVRGYDERMRTYGGEDIDFANRVRRSGSHVEWIEDDRVRMYHMWHPPTAAVHAKSERDSADVAENKRIMREDKTYIRNLLDWQHRPHDAWPAVTVVISTYNRSKMLKEAIFSVMAQTLSDWEIVVVDDGSEDDTEDVVRGIGDHRIRYVRQDNRGVAAARNFGTREARAPFVAVLDDDDICLPWRLQEQLSAITEGVHASFGAFYNFYDDTGELVLHRTKKFNIATTADKGGAPGHATWLVRRDFMLALGYDENLQSGIDNDFALRSLRSGLSWVHTGFVHTLRRMHSDQITGRDSVRQIGNAQRAYRALTFTATPWTLEKLRKERSNEDYVALQRATVADVRPYLPDHLVTRTAVVNSNAERSDDLAATILEIKSPSWADMAALGVDTLRSGVVAKARGSSSDESETDAVLAKHREALVSELSPTQCLIETKEGSAAPTETLSISGLSNPIYWSVVDVADTTRARATLSPRGESTVTGTKTAVRAVIESILHVEDESQ